MVGRVGPAREVQGKPHGGGGTQAESSKDVQVCPRSKMRDEARPSDVPSGGVARRQGWSGHRVW